MKKFFTLAAAIIIVQCAGAQKGNSTERIFKKFKTDVSVGYAISQGSGSQTGTKGGVLFAIEPKYAVLDALSVGLRMEAAVTANIDVNGQSGSAKANASYLLTGDIILLLTNSGHLVVWVPVCLQQPVLTKLPLIMAQQQSPLHQNLGLWHVAVLNTVI